MVVLLTGLVRTEGVVIVAGRGYSLGVQVFRVALARRAPALRAQYGGRACSPGCVSPQIQFCLVSLISLNKPNCLLGAPRIPRSRTVALVKGLNLN